MDILHKQAIPLEYYVQVSRLFVGAGPCNKEQILKWCWHTCKYFMPVL